MDSMLVSLLNFYAISTGRRIFALRQVHTRAGERGFPALQTHCALALEHDRAAHELEARWAAQQHAAPAVDAPHLQRVDGLVDRSLTAFRDGALANATVAAPGDDLPVRVDGLLRELFPAGLGAVTSLPYVEELAAVERILGALQGPRAPLVGELGLERHAARLAQLAVEYRAALEAPKAAALDFGTVRAARARGQELLLQAVAMILGAHPGSTPEDNEGRAALLAPILQQNEAIRQYLRSRRNVEDVDPETGEIDPNAPLSGPAPEGGAALPT